MRIGSEGHPRETPQTEGGPRGTNLGLVMALLSIGPYAVGFTAYGLLLDHLQDGWFASVFLKYALAGAAALATGLVTQDVALRVSKVNPFHDPSGRQTRLVTGNTDPRGNTRHSGSPCESQAVPAIADILDAAVGAVVHGAREGTYGDKTVRGWPQRVDDLVAPSAMGTAYGLRIALAFDLRGSEWDRNRMVEDLLIMQRERGGWAATTQRRDPQPEVTAWVLGAIARAGLPPHRRSESSSSWRLSGAPTRSAHIEPPS